MVVVKIELWPCGQESKKRDLGFAIISNDGTGDKKRGNYAVALSHAGKFLDKKKGTWKKGRVENHKRSLSPYHLVCKALKVALNLKFKD